VGKIIRNTWAEQGGARVARIAGVDDAPEGVEVERLDGAVDAELSPTLAHVVSVVGGRGTLFAYDDTLRLDAGTHVLVPLGGGAIVRAEPGASLSLVRVASPRARAERIVVRHERFVSACATAAQPLRWILTPQYLSRRVFLHHDAALLSARGRPLSWFHTTMFDVAGLPPNDDGEPVFKMGYESRTELNVCYDVRGEARVRYAVHPYVDGPAQVWGPWAVLDGDASYHLDEAEGGPEVEHVVDAEGRARTLRNRHEVYAGPGGHVTLLCMFDPAPVGIEQHVPGAYSDYEPLDRVSARPGFAEHQAEVRRYDAMVETLSLARARGALAAEVGSPAWSLYLEGRAAQAALEAALLARLAGEGRGREAVVAPWESARLHTEE
jgi:hypothetical protein